MNLLMQKLQGVTDLEEEEKATAIEIMHYLESHPLSKDTSTGIQSWWIKDINISLGRVEEALNWLVAHHFLTKESLPDGGIVFSLAGMSE